MLNWIIWNRTVFNIKTVFTLNCLTSLKWKCFWQLNCVLMLNWIVLNRTDYLHKMDLALNNLQRLICHKTQQPEKPIMDHKRLRIFLSSISPKVNITRLLEFTMMSQTIMVFRHYGIIYYLLPFRHYGIISSVHLLFFHGHLISVKDHPYSKYDLIATQ